MRPDGSGVLWAWMTGTQEGFVVLLAIFGAVLGVLFFCFRLGRLVAVSGSKRIRSRARDHIALRIGECLESGKAPPAFALYLRPFQSTGYSYQAGQAGALLSATLAMNAMKGAAAVAQRRSFGVSRDKSAAGGVIAIVMVLTVTAFATDWLLWNGYLLWRRQKFAAQARMLAKNPLAERGEVLADFEDLLEDSVSKSRKINLIGLGNPGESVGGAGRLRVKDDEWQKYASFLMEHSKLNLLVLSPRPGTLWEIEQTLSGGHWKKTLFIQPPLGGVAKGAYVPDADYGAVRNVFAKYGMEIPQRDKRGVAFGINELGKPPSVRANIRSVRSLVYSYRMIGGVDGPLAHLFTNQPAAEVRRGPWDSDANPSATPI